MSAILRTPLLLSWNIPVQFSSLYSVTQPRLVHYLMNFPSFKTFKESNIPLFPAQGGIVELISVRRKVIFYAMHLFALRSFEFEHFAKIFLRCCSDS